MDGQQHQLIRPPRRRQHAGGLLAALLLLLTLQLTSPAEAFTLRTAQPPRSTSKSNRPPVTPHAAAASGGWPDSGTAARAIREQLLDGERAGSLVVSTGRFPLIGMPAWSPPLHVGVLLSVEEGKKKKGGGGTYAYENVCGRRGCM
jgi:hypothetical protein